MSLVTLVRCDVCGRLKVESNHWFVARASVVALLVSTLAEEKLVLDGPPAEHICSRQCLHTRLDRWAEETTTTPTEGANNHGSTSES